MTAEIVPVRFEDVDLAVRPSVDHEWLLTNAEVAAGLGVAEEVVRKMKSRRSAELVEGRHFVVDDEADNAAQSTVTFRHGGPARTLWTKRGVIRLGFWARSSRAKRFRDWAEDLIIQAEAETQPAPVDELEFAERYVASIKARRALEAQVAVLGPKAEAFDEGMSHAGLMTITDFAKKFDYPPRKIFDHLKAHDWIFKNKRGEHREHVDHEAHFEVRDTGRTYADGVAAQQIYLNPLGEEALRRWLKQHPVPGTKRQPTGELIPFPTDGAALCIADRETPQK